MFSLDANLDSHSEKFENYSAPEFLPKDHSKVFIEWTNKQHLAEQNEPKSYSNTTFDEPFIIQSDEEFHLALARFNEIVDAEENSKEDQELNILEKAIDTYWDILYPKESE